VNMERQVPLVDVDTILDKIDAAIGCGDKSQCDAVIAEARAVNSDKLAGPLTTLIQYNESLADTARQIAPDTETDDQNQLDLDPDPYPTRNLDPDLLSVVCPEGVEAGQPLLITTPGASFSCPKSP
jgi:hypothetical protein